MNIRRWIVLSFLIVISGLSSTPAMAQFQQYSAPGSLATPTLSTGQSLAEELKNARWRLGPFHVSPWIGLKNVTYVGNIFGLQSDLIGLPGGGVGEEADVTATVGIGLGVFVPLGSNTIWGAHALPEYVWWVDLEDRRRLNGRYGTALAADFNRFDVELAVTSSETQQIVTPEFEQRINARRDNVSAGVELQVYRSFHVFTTASTSRFRNLLDEEPGGLVPAFGNLDRDEEVVRTGLRLRLREQFYVGVGLEDSDVDFESRTADRSNSGTAEVLELSYQGPTLSIAADIAERSLDPKVGSSLTPEETTSGRLHVGWNQSGRLQLMVYGARDLVYTIDQTFSHFVAERLGSALTLRLRERLTLQVFAESGSHEYTAVGDSLAQQLLVRRIDDVSSFGGEISLATTQRTAVGFRASRSEYDSSVPGQDRDVWDVGLTMNLGLRLGLPDLSWP